ncbi:MAG TPA: AAA family ATPase [Baekduia sp.]|nr:AAA family ATPase [Baekduia sp.]
MLRVEAALVETSRAREGLCIAVGNADSVAAPGLSEEQAAVVREVVLSGDGVQVIRAAAGTGKTTTLAAARAAWSDASVHVYGCALAARAAVELESLGGIDSTTVAHLERDLDQGYGLPRGSVLVVDEAGMVGTRSIARLAAHCADTESKLLLVGDDHQLPEIDAGGAFRRLASELGASELRQVWRQREDWDREALGDLRRGRVGEWAERYRDHGRLVAEPTAVKTRDRLVEDWWHAARLEDVDAVMIAHRRVDVAELNSRARNLMRANGRLGEDELVAGGRAFSVGDRVLAKHNDRRLDLVNGTRGEVTGVDMEHRSVEMRLKDGSTRRADAAFLDREGLMHGYAFTGHAAQGATVDRAFVLGSDDLYREWGYRTMTRHREEARYYVVSPGSVERALPGLEPDPDPLTEDVVASMSRSGRKSTAHDVLDQGFKRLPDRRETAPTFEPTRPSREAKAAERALERAAALEKQLAEVKPWQRKLAKELRHALEEQHKELGHGGRVFVEPTDSS